MFIWKEGHGLNGVNVGLVIVNKICLIVSEILKYLKSESKNRLV